MSGDLAELARHIVAVHESAHWCGAREYGPVDDPRGVSIVPDEAADTGGRAWTGVGMDDETAWRLRSLRASGETTPEWLETLAERKAVTLLAAELAHRRFQAERGLGALVAGFPRGDREKFEQFLVETCPVPDARRWRLEYVGIAEALVARDDWWACVLLLAGELVWRNEIDGPGCDLLWCLAEADEENEWQAIVAMRMAGRAS